MNCGRLVFWTDLREEAAVEDVEVRAVLGGVQAPVQQSYTDQIVGSGSDSD